MHTCTNGVFEGKMWHVHKKMITIYNGYDRWASVVYTRWLALEFDDVLRNLKQLLGLRDVKDGAISITNQIHVNKRLDRIAQGIHGTALHWRVAGERENMKFISQQSFLEPLITIAEQSFLSLLHEIGMQLAKKHQFCSKGKKSSYYNHL